MDIKNVTANLKFKLFHYLGTEEDNEFLNKQFHVTASDWDIDFDSDTDDNVKPVINTLNVGRSFLEKDDYLLYADSEDEKTELTVKLFGGVSPDPILLAPNEFSYLNNDNIIDLNSLLEKNIIKISKN